MLRVITTRFISGNIKQLTSKSRLLSLTASHTSEKDDNFTNELPKGHGEKHTPESTAPTLNIVAEDKLASPLKSIKNITKNDRTKKDISAVNEDGGSSLLGDSGTIMMKKATENASIEPEIMKASIEPKTTDSSIDPDVSKVSIESKIINEVTSRTATEIDSSPIFAKESVVNDLLSLDVEKVKTLIEKKKAELAIEKEKNRSNKMKKPDSPNIEIVEEIVKEHEIVQPAVVVTDEAVLQDQLPTEAETVEKKKKRKKRKKKAKKTNSQIVEENKGERDLGIVKAQSSKNSIGKVETELNKAESHMAEGEGDSGEIKSVVSMMNKSANRSALNLLKGLARQTKPENAANFWFGDMKKESELETITSQRNIKVKVSMEPNEIEEGQVDVKETVMGDVSVNTMATLSDQEILGEHTSEKDGVPLNDELDKVVTAETPSDGNVLAESIPDKAKSHMAEGEGDSGEIKSVVPMLNKSANRSALNLLKSLARKTKPENAANFQFGDMKKESELETITSQRNIKVKVSMEPSEVEEGQVDVKETVMGDESDGNVLAESIPEKRDGPELLATVLKEVDIKETVSRDVLRNFLKIAEKKTLAVRNDRKMEREKERMNILNGPCSSLFDDFNISEWEDHVEKITLHEIDYENELGNLRGLNRAQNEFEVQMLDIDKEWRYPIDNEQDLGIEETTSFEEHVFLDHYLDEFPDVEPIQKYMELVITGLQQNPYISVEEKRDKIMWHKDYFERFSPEDLSMNV